MPSFLLLVASVALTYGCPDGWIYFERSCYSYRYEQLSWENAQTNCRTHNGKLIEIESEQEDIFARSLAKQNNRRSVWIGGNDRSVEGNYIWNSTGERIGCYTNWAPGEPNNNGCYPNCRGSEPNNNFPLSTGADCMSLWGEIDFFWDDDFCSNQYTFICETSAS